ncbi:MAG: CoA transferase [Dehalococcoidales bacterium]|nr:CoA transferase [Dehalococcoidales bacterium]
MNKQALEGVKVLDFGSGIAGPISTRELANHGAQVVHIQTATRTPAARMAARSTQGEMMFGGIPADWYNNSKLSIALNLKHPRSRFIAEKLIRWADIVLENYRPGAMDKLGLGYEQMKQINPGIIYLSSSGHGQTGPYGQQGGVDGIANALSGRIFLAGWPDRGAVNPSDVPYADAVHPLFNAIAMMAALDYKRRTGKGQYLDVSMDETDTHSVIPPLLDWQANGHLQTRDGNRIPNASPHGVFPCIGDDRWCAITVFTDEEWKSFCDVIGNPPWTKEPKFASLNARKEHEDELEELVGKWTGEHTAEDVMKMMQAAGVPAGVVQNARDLLESDPQLKAREWLISLDNPELGTFPHPTPPYKLSKTKAQVRTSPVLGEHTEYVCTKLLEISKEEFDELNKEGVFT